MKKNRDLKIGNVHIPKRDFNDVFIAHDVYLKLKKKYDTLVLEHNKLLSIATIDQLTFLKSKDK